jgi:hypothetical protein
MGAMVANTRDTISVMTAVNWQSGTIKVLGAVS